MKIAVIGSNMVDLTSYITRMPVLGETLEAPDFSMGCGGKGANQAVAAAKYGADVLMMTKVGDDAFADNTIANFQKAGIDTKYVQKVPGVSSGVAPIFVDKSGQNSILIIKGANQYLLPKDIDDAEEDLKNCQLIILQLEISLETVYYAIDFGKKHGIPVLLNPAPATKELLIDKACQCDFFMPNETELAILTEMPVSTLDEVEAAAKSLVDRGLKNVIVTMGSHGSMWISKEGKHLVKPFKVNAIDTSGAGDAYIGCFACCYVQTGDILSSMKTASAFAALSVTKRGTQKSYPEKEDVLKLLKE
ncbi:MULTISPECIES: ribokinase [Mitsuokella]|jgi:ribokinase|uniref:Deoxyribokinase n=3 Tax=Mitsuokella multacida TaxID=52226 RepID=C9KQC4_9FIRM|nr:MULTISPECIES: ribokinase [Mitsuokella]EEX67915.1 ribokinase [Mitsuokella multacida DSM 20544]MDO5583561.1 ribokinase [Mitsuokella multacida]MDY4475243.1 ribokinase [Mitsuokella sp.]